MSLLLIILLVVLLAGGGFGYQDTGYGDIGMYTGSQGGMTPGGMSDTGTSGSGKPSYGGTPFDETESSQFEDIPDIASSQPGSLSSQPSSQSFDRPEMDLSDDLSASSEPKPIRDDDLNTIGRNDPSIDDPKNKPR